MLEGLDLQRGPTALLTAILERCRAVLSADAGAVMSDHPFTLPETPPLMSANFTA